MRAVHRRRWLYTFSVVALGAVLLATLALAWQASVEQRAEACKLLPALCAEGAR